MTVFGFVFKLCSLRVYRHFELAYLEVCTIFGLIHCHTSHRLSVQRKDPLMVVIAIASIFEYEECLAPRVLLRRLLSEHGAS